MRLRGTLLMLTAACMFGLGTVLASLLGGVFQPFFVSWLALSGGGICVSACQLLRRKPLVPQMTRSNWGDMLLYASLGTALPLVCIVAGLARTSVITGSFLLQLQGPAAILCALLFLKEKMARRQIAGILLLLAGSLLIIVRDLRGPLQITDGSGDLLIIVGAVGIGFSYIPGKRLSKHGDVLQIILLRLFAGSLLLMPLLTLQPTLLLAPLSASVLGVLVLYIVTNFGVGYLVQQAGLGLLQAWESAALMQTLPLFSTISALLLLHEALTSLQIIGGSIILVGGLLIL
ncbi:MAG TPA: DMT family transporter [Ktedonobacteraceae bacterium]